MKTTLSQLPQKIGQGQRRTKSLRSPHLIFGLLLTTLIIQAANNSINPIVSLYVRQLLTAMATLSSSLVLSPPFLGLLLS